MVLASRIIERLSSDTGTALALALALNAMSLLPLVTARRVVNLANSRRVMADEDEGAEQQTDAEAEARAVGQAAERVSVRACQSATGAK